MGRNEVVWAIAESLVAAYGDSLAEGDLHLKMAQRVYAKLRRCKTIFGEPILHIGHRDIPKKNIQLLNQDLKKKLGFDEDGTAPY